MSVKKKVLFISSFIGQNHSGGSVASENNLALCKKIFTGFEVDAFGFALSEEPVVNTVQYLPSHKNKQSTFINYTFGNAGSLTFKNIQQVKKIYSSNNYFAVFLDGSLLGKLAKKIKSHDSSIIIITSFHNIERDFFKQQLSKNPLWLTLYLSASHNEKLSVKYADYILCLTRKDEEKIEHYYGRKTSGVVPIIVKDRLTRRTEQPAKVAARPSLLFIGSDFFANTHGLRWFVSNVMPFVHANLIVAGKGMEKYRSELQAANISVLGTVEDIDDLYYTADLIVAPIFMGAGMKVKIAEALMMGKTILGTTEAWTGYDFCDDIGCICNSAHDFIEAIKQAPQVFYKYNQSARSLYEQRYSPFAQDSLALNISKKIIPVTGK